MLQSGEDYGLKTEWIADIVGRIKAETHLAVTLSFGERPEEDLAAWRAAGADRYLLRFETSDDELYKLIHPDLPGRVSDRMAHAAHAAAARLRGRQRHHGRHPRPDVRQRGRRHRPVPRLDLDMIGIGPYISHPLTPLGDQSWAREIPPEEQIPGDELTVYKVVALTRLVCPEANIPSTTALATINKVDGREQGLQRGANIVMPNLTPPEYREKYEIYPDKACVNETAEMCRGCLTGRVESIGRVIGSGPGGRDRAGAPAPTTRLIVRVLTVNAGSSSLKLRVLDEDGSVVAERDLPAPTGLGDSAIIAGSLDGVTGIDAVGHRVVHGGSEFVDPVLIDDAVTRRIDALTPLAPLHQPKALYGIAAVRGAYLQLPEVACFDTAFHARIPAAAATYAIPKEWTQRFGVRRYGFHGLSHAYASRRAAEMVGAETSGAADGDLPPRRRRVARRGQGREVGRHDHGLHAPRGPGDGHPLRRHGPRAAAVGAGHAGHELPPRSPTCSPTEPACWA